ncbi:hypothetical protein M9H77_29846 [Catharanthus roseus]|uniref:Uncharacterized protein n=1 Tax=Catharanthus roseus TaxID=4058 RepID=A0ACB9ZVW3_CATRO|nr:hypothetical protein M9H77_29846 [Catharanthus roseus]
MALVMRKLKRFYKKGFNKRGKKPPFKKGGQSSSLFKIIKKNKELKNKIDNLSNENSKLVCENKTLFEFLEVLKKEKDFSMLEFQKLILENKNLCEKVLSLEKCMVDYSDLKKKMSDLTLCIEKFTKGKENFEKLLGFQRSHLTKMRRNVEEEGSSRGSGKGKRVPYGVRAPDRFISMREATNFEEWTRKRRKITPSHRVDLNDIEGKDIAFDDRLLNNILETPQDGVRFYTKNKKCFDPNLCSERRFEEIFTKGEVLKRHDDRNMNKLDIYGRLLHHMISNITIPNVGHKSSIMNMHSFVMLALHEHRRMNFGFMAIEHMLATQSSSTKCLPYSCFLMKIFQLFVLNLVGVGDHIGLKKIYNKHTFKRMGFGRNKEGISIRGSQDDSDEDDEDN